MMNNRHVLLFAIAVLVLCGIVSAELPKPENPLWTPMADEVYLQETRRHVETESPVNAVAVYEGDAYAGNDQGVWKLEGDALVKTGGPKAAVTRLKTLGGALWAASPAGLWRFDGGAWTQVIRSWGSAPDR